MAETNETDVELHLLSKLLKPSYLSSSIAVSSAAIIIGVALISKAYISTGWLADTLRTIANSDNHFFQSGTESGDSPFNLVLLFLFWASIGLTVYFLVIGSAHAVKESRELGQEMNFVHTNRRAILRNFFGRMIARFAGLALLFVAATLYLKAIVPYSVTVAHDVTLKTIPLMGLALAIIMLLLMMHIIAILLRVIALRPRLFTSEI